jgi:SAM-dependent methyltransferase
VDYDSRARAAEYYDLQPHNPDDIEFYRGRLPSADSRVLELGCGTGRVLVALIESCRFIYGLDNSQAMLTICQRKIDQAEFQPDKARAEFSDITNFDLGEKFDLITAPFRVLQNLDSDAQVSGLLDCVRNHLQPDGTCILTAFNPKVGPEEILQFWATDGETFNFEVPFEDGRLTRHHRTRRIDKNKLVLYPELVYRLYRNEALIDETVLPIAMKAYYPDELTSLIEAHGFKIVNRWGGYADELYGVGSELVVQFALGT